MCALALKCVCVCVCLCVHTDALVKQTTMPPLHNTYNFSCRLLKSRLEKEELDGRLKDLQQSTLATKKQTAASDSSAEVIYISCRADCRLRLAVWAKLSRLIAAAVARASFKSCGSLLTPMSDACSDSSCHAHVISPRLARSKKLRHCQDDLKQARATLDSQRGELDEKREALEALKAAREEKEAELLSEISRLKQQAQKDKAELEKAQEQAKEVDYPPTQSPHTHTRSPATLLSSFVV